MSSLTHQQQAEIFNNVIKGLNFVIDSRLNAVEGEERADVYEVCVKALMFNAIETLHRMLVPRQDAVQWVHHTYDALELPPKEQLS